jgi:hypothetical protein
MKYTGMASPIEIRDLKTYYFLTMNRNQYYDVPLYIADKFRGSMHFFFNECEHIDKLCEKYPQKRFAFHRWGALGDILQLVPVAKYINRTFGCQITLITSPIFQTTFNKTTDAFDEVLHITEFDRYQFDRVIFLEGVLEQDHAPNNRESKIHRVKLYEEFFGISIDRYDFSLNLEE